MIFNEIGRTIVYKVPVLVLMFRRLPPIVQFLFVSMSGIVLGTLAGLIYEVRQQPFSATNTLVWLFLLIVSGGIVSLIVLYGRNKLG